MDILKGTTKFIFVIIFLIELNCVLANEVKPKEKDELFHRNVEEQSTKEVEATAIEARKKEEGMMNKMMPMMIIPFMISTGIIPMMLVSLKFMLMKTAFIGKLAVILLILTMFRNRSDEGGVTTHNVPLHDMHMAHYGYSGGIMGTEEYGAYVNGKSFR